MGFVSCGQGLKVARVLPENLEKALNFPDKGRISTGLKVQEFKVTSPAAPPHSHTAPLCRSRSQLKAGESSKTLWWETDLREGGDVIQDDFTSLHCIFTSSASDK